MGDNQDFGSEFDAALNRQMDSDSLQISFLALMGVKEFIKVCSNDFHEAIILRNDAGQVTNYIPDTLEAFENCVRGIGTILNPYKDEAFKAEHQDVKGKDRDERREIGFKQAEAIFNLMKRINLMPGENSNLIEIIGKTKAERKEERRQANLPEEENEEATEPTPVETEVVKDVLEEREQGAS